MQKRYRYSGRNDSFDRRGVKMKYEGAVYRPWIEAQSILLQVTIGCSNNNCTFCTMFSDKKFRKRELEEVFKDIETLYSYYPHAQSIFLTDGNVMVLGTTYLLKVIQKIKATFPQMQNIALYSELNDLRRKSVEELKALKDAGLDKAYVGLESGDAKVLENIQKNMTPQEAIEGAQKAKEAGIKVLQSFIFGLGGRTRSKEHIKETTRLLNIMKPEEIAPMALTVQPGSVLEKELLSGTFIQATPLQILEEEQYLLENLEDFEMYYWGDHGNNIFPQKGYLPLMKNRFLDNIHTTIQTHPIVKEEVLHTFAW